LRADSAAISIVRKDGTEDEFYQWVASAGVYEGFLNAMLPRYPSACGICLERGRPQVIRVLPRFLRDSWRKAPPVTDGLLLPWRADEVQGTIFVMAHERAEAFDIEDCRMMEMLADFAAMGMFQLKQRALVAEQAAATDAAAMANDLAHQINNPLQGLTNLLFLASGGSADSGERSLAARLEPDFQRLSSLVGKLLAIPSAKRQPLGWCSQLRRERELNIARSHLGLPQAVGKFLRRYQATLARCHPLKCLALPRVPRFAHCCCQKDQSRRFAHHQGCFTAAGKKKTRRRRQGRKVFG
jgi:hypothetical protein